MGECYQLYTGSVEVNCTECFCAELGKMGGGCGVNTVLVSVDSWWYSCHLSLLLISVLIRDVADLEEMSVRKPDKILPHSVLLACKQVEMIVFKQE